ncbi:MAG: alpha-ketoglutarate-dependent dioxygenase AlkB [Gammaproteobacteria bacterium]|nr:alpha-ketoglutarate-dependent dioxygenase AlkB [Gammaproteobacteria bacterium]
MKLNYNNNLVAYGGDVFYLEHFIDQDGASKLYTHFFNGLDWREEQIKIYGKEITVPRRVCWYGDPDTNYTYSGISHLPTPWTKSLLDLKQKIESATQHRFNSVLANLYRDQNDSMGWHADKEKELGNNPFIASLSLGEPRLFRLRHNKSKEIVELTLSHGSLLLMGGTLQHNWQHCIPKTKLKTAARINLTFREIRR